MIDNKTLNILSRKKTLKLNILSYVTLASGNYI